MATESQFDRWRKDIAGSIRKGVEASAAKGDGEVSDADRAWLAINSAAITSNVMVSERLGQIVQILTTSGDDRLVQIAERVRTGEQILSRIVETAEASDLTVEDELMVSITMAEDWLNPEGLVGFATPESVERGTDPQSQEFSEEPINADEEVDPQADLDEEEPEFDDHDEQDLPEDVK